MVRVSVFLFDYTDTHCRYGMWVRLYVYRIIIIVTRRVECNLFWSVSRIVAVQAMERRTTFRFRQFRVFVNGMQERYFVFACISIKLHTRNADTRPNNHVSWNASTTLRFGIGCNKTECGPQRIASLNTTNELPFNVPSLLEIFRVCPAERWKQIDSQCE